MSYCDVFDFEDHPLGQTSVVTHKIDTSDASTIHRRLYRVSHAERHIIQAEVDKVLFKSVIEPALFEFLGIASCVGQRAGWQLAILCRLPSTKQDHKKGCAPSPAD